MSNTPDWFSAAVAVVALGGSMGGIYATTTSKVSVIESKLNFAVGLIEKNAEYDGIVTEDFFELKERVIRTETGLDFLAKGQAELAISIKELTRQLQMMNNLLIGKRMEMDHANKT